MLFKYRALDADGHEREGTVEALSMDVAVTTLQHRSLILSSIEPVAQKSLLNLDDEKRYFSLADIMPAGAKFDEQHNLARNLPTNPIPAAYEIVRRTGPGLMSAPLDLPRAPRAIYHAAGCRRAAS